MFIDVATDRVDGEPLDEENPLIYKSEKTGRGPLKGIYPFSNSYCTPGPAQIRSAHLVHDNTSCDSWYILPVTKSLLISETWIEDQEWDTVFCAYKLCRVEFPFWGFQTRVER